MSSLSTMTKTQAVLLLKITPPFYQRMIMMKTRRTLSMPRRERVSLCHAELNTSFCLFIHTHTWCPLFILDSLTIKANAEHEAESLEGSANFGTGARGWASALEEGNVPVDLNVAARIGNVVARGARRKMSSSWLTSSRLMKTKTLTLLLTTSSTITTRCLMEMEDDILKSRWGREESLGRKGRETDRKN